MNASNLTQLRPASAKNKSRPTSLHQNDIESVSSQAEESVSVEVLEQAKSTVPDAQINRKPGGAGASDEQDRLVGQDNGVELPNFLITAENVGLNSERLGSEESSEESPSSRVEAMEGRVEANMVVEEDQLSEENYNCRKRRSSGSYGGAYESEEEIAFAGLSHVTTTNGEYEREERSRSSSGRESSEEEKIKRKLKFFFMNPVEKYRATKKLPWKLLLQILKVFLVSAQLWIFADFRYAHVNYYTHQTVTFEHYFIKDWDMVREVHAYPPATGKLALYSKSEFYRFVDYAVESFTKIEEDSIAPFFRNSSLGFCVEHYRQGKVTRDLRFKLDSDLIKTCIFLEESQLDSFNGSKNWLTENNFTMPWTAVERVFLNFSLTSVTLQSLGPLESPDCFKFHVLIHLDNSDHDGQIPIDLTMMPYRLMCPQAGEISNFSFYPSFVVVLNLVVIGICASSLLLCVRALLRAQLLKHESMSYLQQHFGWSLTINERMDFLNLWYIMICANDCLIIIGSIIKQLIESHSSVGDIWDICSLLLGTGNLLVWFGLLRYLGFFKTYNVLILTMKGAAPNVLRFLLCASFIYIGFVFAGWLILGPYHFKFETIMSTSECLFSLINGDDMFATFNSIPMERAMSVWIYSRIYLYFFISLFIYVILSLFISIIMDTYEIIKTYYERGFPCNRLEQFYSTSEFDFNSGSYSCDSIGSRLCSIVLRSSWMTRRRNGYEEIG